MTAPATAGSPAAPTTALPPGVARKIAILALSAFAMILNETVLSVALPQLMVDFGVSATSIQWLSTGFMLTMAVVIPTTGFLLQRFTARSLFIAALGLFLSGSLLAAVAPGFELMLLARVIQAGGTAIIMPLLMTTTLSSVPPARRGAMMGMNTIVIACAPALGPLLAGLILGSIGWRWIFWLMVAIAAVTLVVGLGALPAGGTTRRAPFDALSVVLSAFGFGGLVYALSAAETALTGAWVPAVVALLVGVVGLVLFVVRQRSLQVSDAALMDLRPFGVATFRRSVITVCVAFGVMLGSVVLLSMVLQQGLGLSSLTVGLVLLPAGLIQAVLAPLVGRLYDRVGPRPLILPGTVLLAGSMFALATINPGTPVWFVLVFNTLYGAGMVCVLTALLTTALSSLPHRLYGHGSAIMNTFQQLAGAAGTAVLIAALTFGAAQANDSATGAEALTGGARLAFIIAGALCLVAVATALLIRPAAPEASAHAEVSAHVAASGKADAEPARTEAPQEAATEPMLDPLEALADVEAAGTLDTNSLLRMEEDARR